MPLETPDPGTERRLVFYLVAQPVICAAAVQAHVIGDTLPQTFDTSDGRNSLASGSIRYGGKLVAR